MDTFRERAAHERSRRDEESPVRRTLERRAESADGLSGEFLSGARSIYDVLMWFGVWGRGSGVCGRLRVHRELPTPNASPQTPHPNTRGGFSASHPALFAATHGS